MARFLYAVGHQHVGESTAKALAQGDDSLDLIRHTPWALFKRVPDIVGSVVTLGHPLGLLFSGLLGQLLELLFHLFAQLGGVGRAVVVAVLGHGDCLPPPRAAETACATPAATERCETGGRGKRHDLVKDRAQACASRTASVRTC